MPRKPYDTPALTQAGLNLIQQALSIYDSDLKLAVSNRKFAEMFSLPAHLTTPGADFSETIRFLVDRGEYGEVLDPDGSCRAASNRPWHLNRITSNAPAPTGA